MADKVVPTVSSGTAGPLGVLHLPRLWAKLTLFHAGKLPDDYDHCGPGFDQMTLDAMKLDRDKVIDFMRDEKPTYVQFEQYVKDQNDGAVPQAAIDAHNAAVTGYNHGDDTANAMRNEQGHADSAVSDAVTLNTLDDLHQLHAQATGATTPA